MVTSHCYLTHGHVPPFPHQSYEASSCRVIMRDNPCLLSYRLPAVENGFMKGCFERITDASQPHWNSNFDINVKVTDADH